MNGALAIQKIVYDALIADSELISLLGGPHIYDDLPKGQGFPHVSFGEIRSDDWSTGTEQGLEHFVEILIWSDENGRKQLMQIADAVRDALKNVSSSFGGHHLVNLTHEYTKSKRDNSKGYFKANIIFRLVSEPIA